MDWGNGGFVAVVLVAKVLSSSRRTGLLSAFLQCQLLMILILVCEGRKVLLFDRHYVFILRAVSTTAACT